MKGARKRCLLASARSSVTAALLAAMLASPSLAQTQDTRRDREGRPPVTLTLPLVFNGAAFGEVSVRVGSAGDIDVASPSLRSELARLLNDAGRQALDRAIAERPFVAPADLAPMGIVLRYDTARLELVIDQIDNGLRVVESLGGSESREDMTPVTPVADFSAYLNTTANVEYMNGGGGIGPPDLFMFGAARYRDFVVEVDGGFTDSFSSDGYRFYRRGVRGVYDDQRNMRRFSIGDLRLDSLSILQTQFMGGIAVEKRRRIFDPFRTTTSVGNRRIFLDSASTVDVIVNGSPYRTLDLQPGVYDLSELPMQYGSNDVRLVIRDAAGREQVTSFSHFFDFIDLDPGEEEYTAALGVMARELSFAPEYSKDPIFVGSYRKAFRNQLVLGGGVQIGKRRQVVAAETRIVPQVIPGAFDLQGAASLGGKAGFAARAAYRWSSAEPDNGRGVSFSVDYRSSNFRLVADPFVNGSRQLSATAAYTQNFGQRTSGTAGLTYSDTQFLGKRKGVYADVSHTFTPRIRGTVGAEYDEGSRFAKNYGVRARLSVLFGNRRRADAAYESRRDTARLSFARDGDNSVGSVGYGLTMESTQGQKRADVSASYVANRFDARLNVSGTGTDFGGITSQNNVRLQVATSIAYADGMFGVGRPINDSFVLTKPHRTLRGSEVIIGRELSKGRYDGRSGALGAAVVQNLTSYSPQNILYDIDSMEAGYNIGSGIVRVNPSFRSGAAVVVGTDRFVSALGFLTINDDPAALRTGTLTAIDDEGFPPQPFFTNSAGRFGIIGLAPGRSYRVDLQKGPSFTIRIPSDNKGLYKMDPVRIIEKE